MCHTRLLARTIATARPPVTDLKGGRRQDRLSWSQLDIAQSVQNVSIIVGIAGGLVGIAGFMLVSFWRGASLVQTITKAITDSEERLRNENRQLGDKIEKLQVEVAVLSTKLDERTARQTQTPQQLEIDPEQFATRLFGSASRGH